MKGVTTRRVVTRHDAQGLARFGSDSEIEYRDVVGGDARFARRARHRLGAAGVARARGDPAR